MKIQWCSSCHWESKPLGDPLSRLLQEFGSDLFGGVRSVSRCPECGSDLIYEVEKAS